MHAASIARRRLPWLAALWMVAAAHTVSESTRPGYQEFKIGLTPRVEWPRAVFVWAVLAAELFAFSWLLHRVASATSLAQRGLWIVGGLAVAFGMTLTIQGHGPPELYVPGRFALLLAGAGVAIGLVGDAHSILTRIRARTD